MKVKPDGFRKELKDYFTRFVLARDVSKKQSTPFIVVSDKVEICHKVEDLLDYYDETEVLQGWPGKQRTDVFYFTVKQLRAHIKGQSK